MASAPPSVDEPVYPDGLRLLADVGAKSASFALESAPGHFVATEVTPVERHASLEAAARAFLDGHGAPPVRHAAFSLANPITGDWVKITNHEWEFSIEAVRRNLKLQTLLVVNDFTALAMTLPGLEPAEVVKVGGGEPLHGGVLGVIGPGTGLGVSGLIPFQDHNVALGTEGGHVTYPPRDADEALAVALAHRRFGHASAERLISGPGLELIYEALAKHERHVPARMNAVEISAAAQADPADPVARRALSTFCAMLGTVAGNLALTLGCVGGLYIGGGIVPKLLGFFQASKFRERFEQKGRFTPWLSRIPTYVIAAPRTALRGVSALLESHLAAAHGAGRLLDEVRTALPRLSAAERQVAQDVLSAPRAWLTDPVVQIAERCGVSTPTVLRFCRSVGFKGLADFKLRLGAGLAGSTQVTHTEVQASDPAAERFAKIFNNSISALVGLRDRLRPEAFERAVAKLAKARRIEVFGAGSASLVAEETQHKLGRLGLVAVARTEPQLQAVTASFLSAEDVLLVLSNAGTLDSSDEPVARARKCGATVVALCPQHSDLARMADVVLPVDHPDDEGALVPMVSRLMQTVIIDVLVTDLALKRRDFIDRALARQDDQRFGVLSSHMR